MVVSIPKKGDLTLVDNYRRISLMSTVLKILCVILADCLQAAVETKYRFSRAQAGFRWREECVMQAACLVETAQW